MILQEDYKYYKEIIKINSKSFFKAFSILPKVKRDSVYAIYAFCRQADDAIDKWGSMEKLLKLEKQLNGFLEARELDNPIFRALKDTFSKFDLDIEPFYHMLEGQKMDYKFSQPENMEEFKDYCYHVAGSVGLMLLPIIATENKEELKNIATGLGEAMQITNILRDVGEDYREGRIYIPKTLIEKYPGSMEAIQTSVVNEDFIEVWEYLANIAEGNYRSFLEKLNLFDRDSRKAVGSSALYYGEILNVVRKNDYDCLTKRNYVSSFNILNLKLRNILKV